MSLLKALMPAIAALSSPAQATPPAINDPMLKFEQRQMFQPQVTDYNAPPTPKQIDPPALETFKLKNINTKGLQYNPDPRTPKVPLVLAPPWRDALSHDRNLTKEDIAGQISSGYAGNPNYLQGVLDGEKQIPFIKQKDYQLRDDIVRFAIENNKDPRVFLSQVLHETSNFKDYPSFNPGGVKPSAATTEFINLQPDKIKAQVASKLTQMRRTRETITPDVEDLKRYFSNPGSKFEPPKKERDIRQLTNEQLAGLNEKLTSARSNKTPQDWQSLADEVESLTELFPQNGLTNKFFQVTQPFMRYENTQDGLRDMQRARGMLPGEKDLSTWGIDAAGNINRLDGKGKPMGSYKGTK